MIADYVPSILGVIVIATYILELWTGIAVAGWSGGGSWFRTVLVAHHCSGELGLG